MKAAVTSLDTMQLLQYALLIESQHHIDNVLFLYNCEEAVNLAHFVTSFYQCMISIFKLVQNDACLLNLSITVQ